MDRWEKGMLAKSLAGHDEGKIYVIINIEENHKQKQNIGKKY